MVLLKADGQVASTHCQTMDDSRAIEENTYIMLDLGSERTVTNQLERKPAWRKNYHCRLVFQFLRDGRALLFTLVEV
jgi:hypothetical protein